ncbi:efflux RND transporter periplasmic adaptor subunit [Comamonas terrigena]|uniref:efflux RND transporter periplasmic adaptor subunit n=1 Tax=Comamonas terrigena TaxID=32013 RepID=UPI00289ADC3E|nr:efflux RND transporter periplasmic adaptor subunit [Comamonas terrigena]
MKSSAVVRMPVSGVLVGVVAALSLVGCSPKPAAEEPVRAVKLVTVGSSQATAVLEYSGEVRARIESRLGFRVAGKLVQRQVDVGQHVQPGQVLAQLDGNDYALAAQAAQAQVAAATTQRDLAAADFARYQALKDKNFISGAELDRRSATLKSAQAQLDQAKANASSQSNQSGYTRLLADVAGIVTAVDAEPGQVVSAGAPVVRIAQDGERDVVFAVPEDKRSLVRIGQAVQVRPWADGEALLQGKVREVAASADPVTRTYTVKVALAGGNVPPLGATVHVLPEGMGPAGLDVIKLPTAAVRELGGQSAVWVYDPQTKAVASRKVTVATADGNDAVIAEGLTPGMQVVAAGVHVLSEGQQVTVYQDKYAPKPAAEQPTAPATAAIPAKADGKPAAAAQ